MWHQNSRCYLLQGCLKAYSTTLDQFIYLFFGRAKGNCHRTLIFLLILLHWQKLNWELGSSMELICPNCEAVQKFENPNLLLLLHMKLGEWVYNKKMTIIPTTMCMGNAGDNKSIITSLHFMCKKKSNLNSACHTQI